MIRLLSTSLAVLLALIITSVAFARPLTRAMSCAQAQNLVARSGAIVLDTAPHIYDRYVRNAQFCYITQTTEPAWAPTRDNPQCLIGYTCSNDTDWQY